MVGDLPTPFNTVGWDGHLPRIIKKVVLGASRAQGEHRWVLQDEQGIQALFSSLVFAARSSINGPLQLSLLPCPCLKMSGSSTRKPGSHLQNKVQRSSAFMGTASVPCKQANDTKCEASTEYSAAELVEMNINDRMRIGISALMHNG